MTNDRTTHDDGHGAGNRDGQGNDGRDRGPQGAPTADDPRLTAYALGELDGEEHAVVRAQIEAFLGRDAGARDEVARVRAMADTLRAELAAESADVPAPALGASQRAAVDAALAARSAGEQGTRGGSGAGRRERSILLRYAPAVAATLLVGMALWAAWDWNGRADVAAPEAARRAADGKLLADADLRQDAATDRLRSLPYLGSARETAEAPAARIQTAASTAVPVASPAAVPNEAPAAPQLAGGQGGGGGGSRLPSGHGGSYLGPSADGGAVGGANMTAPTNPGVSARLGEGQADQLYALEELGYVRDAAGPAPSSGNAQPATSGADAHLTGRGRLGRKGAASGASMRMSTGSVGGAAVAKVGATGDEYELAFDAEEPVVADAAAADDKRPVDRRHELRYWVTPPTPGTESYAPIVEAGFQSPYKAPLSTFSVDVDTASYANVRRFLNQGGLPPKDAVRIEELVNYFHYDYAPPAGGPDGDAVPFATHVAVTECPWAPNHRLVRIGLKGREVPTAERPASNLVFLADVSGSMNSQDKLPLLVASLKLLVNKLDERDRVALVTYAGNAGLVLEPTACDGPGRVKLIDALDRLRSGGSTHGSAGIRLAYETAAAAFEKGGTNRVILATDGDFNVGVTDRGELERLITDSAKSGVFLSVLGFGTGNLKDGTAELLADKGNGNYSYIDSLGEAQKVLVNEMGGTLVTIAKDVKLQVEFNPAKVEAYRLIGYENRTLAAQDFNDDRKDAGEIGAGHTVTALYEVVPPGAGGYPSVDELKYQASEPLPKAELVESEDLLNVKLRWKAPDGDVSTKIEVPVVDEGRTLAEAGPDVAFAAAVASFGMLLRDSEHAGAATWDTVMDLAERGRGTDRDGYRAEFLRLAQVARGLSGN